jgi:pimeloyl-ACP methyl ester carboxylesterase
MAAPVQHRVRLAHGELAWLEAGPADAASAPLVLLHGIGSCASSWRAQLAGLSSARRVLAWDAPGSGDSAPLAVAEPKASDYAAAAAAWLVAAGVGRVPGAPGAVVVVGHSLGALMAAALAARAATDTAIAIDIAALVLASPAQGYASASAEVRAAKVSERLDALRALGPERMAAERAARLCAPGAPQAAVDEVRGNMARVREPGYAQAAWMLSNDAIVPYLAAMQAPVQVLCGALDVITPPHGAKKLAERIGAPFTLLPAVGHACYVEDAMSFDAALLAAIDRAAASPPPPKKADHG